MSTKVLIDGSSHTGNYRCECDCDTSWNGQGEVAGIRWWSPALPIAEAVVHIRMCHQGERLDLLMTDRFEKWLCGYWERDSARRRGAGHYGVGSMLPAELSGS